MSSQIIRELADQIFDMLPDPATSIRPMWGTVKALQASNKIVIQITGATVLVSGVRHDAAYSPVVGDTVYGRIVGTDILVEGKCA